MKMLKSLSIAIMLSLLMSLAASAQEPQWRDKLHNITITALIDGRDFFYITPTKIHWHHLDFVVVGRYYGNWPTGLLMDRQAPNTQYFSWIPTWPCYPSCYDKDSSKFAMDFPLPSKYQLKELKVLQAPNGGSVTTYQNPGPENKYTTIVDFNDDPLGGPHWYQVRLTFAEVKSAGLDSLEAEEATVPSAAAQRSDGLTTIYSNLGAGDTLYDCCRTLTSAGPSSPVGETVEVANAFIPTADATITEIQMALSYALGTKAIRVSLRADNNGVPGEVITFWSPTDFAAMGECCALVNHDFLPGIPVKGGTQYWLVVRQTAASADAWNGWNVNTVQASGPFAIKIGKAPFKSYGARQQGGFAILGQ